MTDLVVGETNPNLLRVHFQIVAVDGINPALGEAGGQPQVSVNDGPWTNTGIGTLVAVGNGRYYAYLDPSLLLVAETVIQTRYKSVNTAECPGDDVRVVLDENVLYDGQTAGGSTRTRVALAEAYDVRRGARYVGAVLVVPGMDDVVRQITGYGNNGSGSSYVTVANASGFDVPLDPGVEVTIVESGGGGTSGGGVAQPPGAATGYYAQRSIVFATAGEEDFVAEASLDSDDDPTIANEGVVQLCLDNADTNVDTIAAELGVRFAGDDGHAIATDDLPTFGLLKLWASRWARADLHQLRGERNGPAPDDPDGPQVGTTDSRGIFAAMKNEADKKIRGILKAKLTNGDGSGFNNGQDGPLVVSANPARARCDTYRRGGYNGVDVWG